MVKNKENENSLPYWKGMERILKRKGIIIYRNMKILGLLMSEKV